MQRRKIAFTLCLGLAVMLSPGAISTQESGFESGRSGRAHGSADRQRLGARSHAELTILDSRRRIGLVDTLRRTRSGEELTGRNPDGKRRRPRSGNRNRLQRLVRIPAARMDGLLPVRDFGRHHQRVGSAVQSQRRPHRARYGSRRRLHRLSHYQQDLGEFPVRRRQCQQQSRRLRRNLYPRHLVYRQHPAAGLRAVRHSGHRWLGLRVVCEYHRRDRRLHRHLPGRREVRAATGAGCALEPALGNRYRAPELWKAEQHSARFK